EGGEQQGVNARRRLFPGHIGGDGAHAGEQGSFIAQSRSAAIANLRVDQALVARCGVQQAISREGQGEVFKIVAIHAKHLITCASGAESSPAARNLFDNKTCPRCSREFTVPKGQSSASAASA